jgi:cytochrome b561/polyisoprenoid-binding protein YceI
MALSNSTTHYGSVTKTFHWLTALLILSLIPLGWYAERLPYETDIELARKAWLFSLHKTLGVTAFFVALGRILWAFGQRKPGLLNAEKKAESFAAETVHWALYGALVIVPLSGWISHAAAAGFAPIWWPFGQGLPLVPKSTNIEHIFSAVHWIATKVLILSLVLHIAGALKHHCVDSDATLRRMLPGAPSLPPIPKQRHSAVPVVSALALWAAVLAGGTIMGASETQSVAAAELAEVRSEWVVEQGSIEIGVVQFGTDVTGRFADWTADITFDETSEATTVGSVTTTISIPSLTLGSVTQQAMGADFFDAPTFPTAAFDAVINRGNDGYDAVGTLTIRDQSIPVTLSFDLTIVDGLADMRGSLMLDRRDFAIGANMNDESSLAFAVKVDIALTARRPSDG